MTEFKAGDKVRIVKNQNNKLIVDSPFQSYDYLGSTGIIREFNFS